MTLSSVRSLAKSVALTTGYYASTVCIGLASAFGGEIPDIEGTPGSVTDVGGVRDLILKLLKTVLDFIALIAVVFIVIAGIRLIVSGGDEDAKNKAKTTILYVILGLLVILFARVIVGFFASGGGIFG